MDDLALVRQYEPVLRFHRDENFYPIQVENYLRKCSLHVIKDEKGVMRIPPPYVELDDLPLFSTTDHFLVYADREEVDESEAQELRNLIERQKSAKSIFDLPEAIEEEIASRGIDVLHAFKPFSMPEEIFQQAKENYGGLSQQSPTYYYRVTEADGYTMLQYWFFYPYNDFHTSHGGSNDHEGDWENVIVYLQADKPAYAVYASHGGGGEHHRRAWDELTLINSHPMVYVAAGSHGSYFTPELAPVEKKRFRSGEAVGPGSDYPYAEPKSLDVSWCEDYQGRWGARQWDRPIYEVGDNKGGPPTGPKFNRDGTVRVAWADPLAYADLK